MVTIKRRHKLAGLYPDDLRDLRSMRGVEWPEGDMLTAAQVLRVAGCERFSSFLDRYQTAPHRASGFERLVLDPAVHAGELVVEISRGRKRFRWVTSS